METKPRYEILDGLRGIAAITVLCYHHFEVFCMSDPMMPFINHGYLAVDFFFILSGFVIGYAYDDRWGKMTTWQFFKRRLIRLHPMIVFATIFCMCTFYLGMGGDVFPLIKDTGFGKLLLFGLLSILMVPCTPSMDIRGWSEMNPINGNAWTLYFEYFANILYALVIRHFPKWLLAFFVALTAVLTLDLTLNIDMFGLLGQEHARDAFTVIGGWTANRVHLYVGFTRLLYPFFCGLLLSRIMASLRQRREQAGLDMKPLRGGFWWCSLALAVLLFMPRLGGYAHPLANGIYEAVAILLLFPALVWTGARSNVTGRSAAICKWLGEISYPLYVTHYGIVFGILQPWATAHPESTVSQHIGISIGSILVSIFIADAALRLYDMPVRKWLSDHLNKRSAQTL